MISATFIIEALFLGLALSMDSFTVSITCGLQKSLSVKRGLFMAFSFGLFQGLFPLLGSLLGIFFKEFITVAAPWICFALLFVIGLKMIIEGKNFKLKNKIFDISSSKVIFLLSIATSIDAFVVGIGFGMQYNLVEEIFLSITIFLITFIMSILGWKMGEKVHFIKPRFALFVGGVILIIIGLKALISYFISAI